MLPATTYLSGLPHSVIECPIDLGVDLAPTPWTLMVIISDLPCSPDQHPMSEIRRDDPSAGEGADCEALGIQGDLLLSGCRLDDSATSAVECSLGVRRETG